MTQIIIYTTSWCGYCHAAKNLLEQKKLPYEEISVDNDPDFRNRMYKLSGRTTVPQVFINGESVGGFQELSLLVESENYPLEVDRNTHPET